MEDDGLKFSDDERRELKKMIKREMAWGIVRSDTVYWIKFYSLALGAILAIILFFRKLLIEAVTQFANGSGN